MANGVGLGAGWINVGQARADEAVTLNLSHADDGSHVVERQPGWTAGSDDDDVLALI